jgi:hypothetical protein
MNDIAGSHAAPGPRPGRLPRAAPVAAAAPRSQVDRALAAFGVLIALSSLGFAGYMVSDVDRPTRIAGMEYLAIFARPSHSTAPPDERVRALAELGQRNAPTASIDATPTGSISPLAAGSVRPSGVVPAGGAADAKSPSIAFRLLYVANGEGLLQTDVGILHVKAGDVLPTLGRIESIEKVGERWVMVSQNGAALQWPPAADGGPGRSGPAAP